MRTPALNVWSVGDGLPSMLKPELACAPLSGKGLTVAAASTPGKVRTRSSVC